MPKDNRVPAGLLFTLSRLIGDRVHRLFLLSSLLLLLPLGVGAQTAGFRFAWLSDTHVGSETAEADLRASVADINTQTNLSFVIISGDITEYGSFNQLRLAKTILDDLKLPCHVIPGNHDTKWSESGATDFARLWPDDRFVFEACGYTFVGIHQGPLMKMGDGHWSPQDVRWLETALKAMKNKEQPVIFVTHYPIDDQIANWYVVLDLLKQYNTQAVLCGHGHGDHKLNFEGVPAAMGRSNLRAGHPGPGYNVVEIKDGTLTITGRTPGQPMPGPWHTIRLEKHNYAADPTQYARPDFSVNARYPQVKARWTYRTGNTIASAPALWQPALRQNLVIVGDASGTVYGLKLKSGQPAWTFKSGNAVYSTPAISDGLVVFGCADQNVYALKAATGKQVWKAETGRPIVASPAIAEGLVFIGSSEGKFRAFELATGKPAWEFDGVAGFIETKPLVYAGKVIFGAWDENLYALDQKTGKLAWKWKGDRRGTLLSPAACWPMGAHDRVFVVAPDRRLTAIDVHTGKQLWRTAQYEVRESIGLSADQSRLYARAMHDSFYAFSTTAAQATKDQLLLWNTNAHFGYDINSAMLAEKDGTLFYGTKNDLLFALDAKTGAIRWQHKLGVGIMNTVLPLSANEVVATDFDGQVALIGK